MGKLDERVAIVTGGGRGIGVEYARFWRQKVRKSPSPTSSTLRPQ